MKKLVMIILIVCSYSLQFAQPISPNEREILQLQDQRSLGNGKLVGYLKDHNAQLRYSAAIALANIQDSSAVEALAISLKDSANTVREASALALGQIKTERGTDELLSALSSEKDENVVARILEAIGKSGSQKTLDTLLSISEQNPLIIPQKEFAMCIARFAIRQIKTERSIWKCFEYVNSESPEVCSTALYALWRSEPSGLIDLEISKQKEELLSLAKNKNSDVRMNLAILLGKSKSKDSREILDTLEIAETSMNDWRVQVQIVRARLTLYSSADERLSKYLKYLSAENDHIKIAALQAFVVFQSPLTGKSQLIDSIRLTIRGIANDSVENEAVRGEALIALGKHFPKELESLFPWIADSNVTYRLKAKLLEGAAQRQTKEHFSILRLNLNHESNRVSMAAWDFIAQMLHPAAIKKYDLDSNDSKNILKDIFKEARIALGKKDIGITTIVSNLFADTIIFKSFKTAGLAENIAGEFISSFGNLTHSDDLEAKKSILQALGNMKDSNTVRFLEKELLESERSIAVEAAASLHLITGKDYSSRLPLQAITGRTEEDWQSLESIKPQQSVRIETNRGEITIELMKKHSPFTVLNFVKLIKKGFYNGLLFHRVVPSFVIQGGDPRGDGWGGPGYKMRTEISNVNYERGSCGMASAGKDTEGSQFFITHVATPHLDGRYTIFAKVIKGMEVVDRIQIGDTIKTIQLISE